MNMNAFELNSTLNQFLDKKSIKTYNLIDCFSTNKELIHKFLDDKDMSYLELSNLHLRFAVTIRNENGRLKNSKIIPCFIIKIKETRFLAYPVDVEHASKLYHTKYNKKIVDDEFDTNYGTNGFFVDKNTNVFKFDDTMEPSTSNTKFFSTYEDAKDYLNLYTKWFHTKKKEDDDRKKNGTFTIDEIAEKLGISPTDLKIVDENTTYYDGTCPENYGELEY